MAEGTHWFLRARRAFLIGFFRGQDFKSKILEVGCSGGLFIKELHDLGFVGAFGVDINNDAVRYGKERGIDKIQTADGNHLPFLDGEFDFVVSSDVLEHIQFEDKALREWHRILREGGELLLTVPAFRFLWSEHDVANQHYRRYTRMMLAAVLRRNGFRVVRSSYWNFFLFLPIFIIRLIGKFMSIFTGTKNKPQDQLIDFGRYLNAILEGILRLENFLLLKGINFPFGVSVFVIAKK